MPQSRLLSASHRSRCLHPTGLLACRAGLLPALFFAMMAASPCPAQDAPSAPDEQQQQQQPKMSEEDMLAQSVNMTRQERLEMHRRLIQRRLEENSRQESEAMRMEQEARAQAAQAQAQVEGVAPTAPPPVEEGAVSAEGAPPAEPAQSFENVQSVLHTSPLNVTLRVGERVAVDYLFNNRREVPVDTIVIALEYPAWGVAPVAVYAEALDSLMRGPAELEHDSNRGRLICRMRLRQPTRLPAEQVVMQVVWEGIAPMRATSIRYLMEGDWATAVTERGTDRLGRADSPTDGTISSAIQVRPDSARLPIQRTADGGYVSGRFRPDDIAGDLMLFLHASVPVVMQGEEFVVHAMLNNPERAAFESVDVVLNYDPAVLEVIDDDLGARIRRGINVNDSQSPFAQRFDTLHINEANPRTGTIRYRKAAAQPLTDAEGELFRVRFKAREVASSTAISLRHEPSRGGDIPASSIAMGGRNLLLRDPLRETATVRVIADPRPPAVLAAMAKEAAREEQRRRDQQAERDQMESERETGEGLEVPLGQRVILRGGLGSEP